MSTNLHITERIDRLRKKIKNLSVDENTELDSIKPHLDEIARESDKIIELLLFSLIKSRDSFYGQFLIRLNRQNDFSILAPAAVNFQGLYFNLFINPLFYYTEDFDSNNMIAILIHEIYHICNNHITRGKKLHTEKSPYLVNVAQDLAINQYIKDIPEGSVNLTNVDMFVPGLDLSLIEPEQNFEVYLKHMIDQYNSDQKTKDFVDEQDAKRSRERSNGGQGKKDENHQMWEDDNQDGNGSGDGTNNNKPGRMMDDHRMWDESDDDAGENESKNVLKKIFDEAKSESRGTVPAALQKTIDALFTPPAIPWQQVLKQYVGQVPIPYKKTITRKDRRQPHRNDIKGRISDHIVDIHVAIDTSGSMTDNDIKYALSEVLGIVKNVKSTVTVIECDAEVQRVYTIKKKSDIKTKVKGLGGTSFTPEDRKSVV